MVLTSKDGDTENYWTVKYFLEEQVKKVFDEEGIEIPYPQVDVHIAGNVQDNK